MKTILISSITFLARELIVNIAEVIRWAGIDDALGTPITSVKIGLFLLDHLIDAAACTLVGFAIPKVCNYLFSLTITNKNNSSTQNHYQS